MPIQTSSLRRWITAAAVGGVALGLAACGSSNHTGTTHSSTVNGKPAQASGTVKSSTSPATSTGTATTGTGTGTATTGTSSTPGSGGAGFGGSSKMSECGTSGLSVKQIAASGATGHSLLVYALTNTGSSSCYTFGWPGAQFLSRSGSVTLANPTRVTRDYAGSVGAPKRITLNSGGEASFRLVVADVASGGGGACTAASEIEITPPNNTTSLKLPLSRGTVTCGSATITPVVAGTGANPS